MTGVPRLQQLPVPATAARATAGALAEAGGGQRAKALVPVTPIHAAQAHTGRSTAWAGGAEREQLGDDTRGGRSAPPSSRRPGEGAAGRLPSFSRLSALPFMVQVLGQQAAPGARPVGGPQTSLTGHRDAALLGSDSYRRAGGEPAVLPDNATFVRLAV